MSLVPDVDPVPLTDTATAAAPGPAAPRFVTPEQVTLRLLAASDAPALLDLEIRNREQLLVGAPEREEGWFTEAGHRPGACDGREVACERGVRRYRHTCR